MAVTERSTRASGTGSVRAIRVYVNVTSGGAVSSHIDFYSQTPLYYNHMPMTITGFYGPINTNASYNSSGGAWKRVWSRSGGSTKGSATVSATITTPAVSQSGRTVVSATTTARKPGGSSGGTTVKKRKPSAPRNFTLYKGRNTDGTRYLLAKWDAPSDMGNNGSVTYIVEWNAPEIGSKDRKQTTAREYKWTHPWPDMKYTGHVLAYNKSGGSAWSNSSSVTMYPMTFIKHNGVWKGGRWWVKYNGVWKQVFPWVNKNGKWRNH